VRFLLALGLCLLVSGQARAEFEGTVFVDANTNGVRDADESGLGGVVVTNGLHVVRSDPEGRYALPERDGFVYLTRPDGFQVDTWYRTGGGDFALVPTSPARDFFFIQISDSHVFDRMEDYATFLGGRPWFVPEFVADWFTVDLLEEIYGDAHPDGVINRLREELAPFFDAGDLSDRATFRAYSDELARPGSELDQVTESARAAFAEVAAQKPSFVIATGDLVLEGNRATPEAMERWLVFYTELANSTGLPFYNTIGNNEITGSQNRDMTPDHPAFGKAYFKRFFGPTYYSFDRGPFHFVALDTHRHMPLPPDRPRRHSFAHMPDAVYRWVEADLSAHAGSVLVVLNHEPFHFDPAWPFENNDSQRAVDLGVFERHDVRYVLTGHIHFNSFWPDSGTIHITTGALSGFRWGLPASVHPRGYRLFYTRDGELYSAWKQTGKPLIAIAQGPPRDGDVVLAFADATGPFQAVRVERAGVGLPLEPWGTSFARVPLEGTGEGALVVTATLVSGESLTLELDPAASPR
jgi:3',5'-cyclic AMP phosphodiesterase CpdA